MTSAAVEGLVHAIKLFDPAKGFKFSTYAHWWVRQSVNKILSVESRVVYVPQNVYELSIQAANVTAKLQPKYFPDSVPEEKVAEDMGVTLSRLREIRSAVREPVNMNQPVGADNASEIGELISVRPLCLHRPLLSQSIGLFCSLVSAACKHRTCSTCRH